MNLYVCYREKEGGPWIPIEETCVPWDQVTAEFKKETGFGLHVRPRMRDKKFFSYITNEWDEHLEHILERCTKELEGAEESGCHDHLEPFYALRAVALMRAWINLLTTFKVLLERGTCEVAILGE